MTLEEIMRDVTPAETLKVLQLRSENNQTWFISGGYKDVGIAYWMSEPDAKLFLRSARNFAPLVKALQGLVDQFEDKSRTDPIITIRTELILECEIALAEALRKEA